MQAREGALFAFECLVEKLGRLFEPYVIHVLPMLLVAFGDGDPAVREATDGASRAIMSQLSGQGEASLDHVPPCMPCCSTSADQLVSSVFTLPNLMG